MSTSLLRRPHLHTASLFVEPDPRLNAYSRMAVRMHALAERTSVHLQNFLRYGRILRHIGHIATAHMRGLLSKNDYVVAYGLSFERERDSDGCRVRRPRTQSRIRGTDNLLKTHPWASAMEEEIFLLGFDAGEAFALGNSDKPESRASALSYPHGGEGGNNGAAVEGSGEARSQRGESCD
jgi:hypothetical protein